MALIRLTLRDRKFFSLVSAAAFANPFGRARLDLDRQIAGTEPGKSWYQVRPEAIHEVISRIKELDDDGVVKIDDFVASDRELMKNVFLFNVYHRFNLDFDRLIVRQVEAGLDSIETSFAREVVRALAERGLDHVRGYQYLAMFYQIRRAFYFIEHSLVGQSRSMESLRTGLWNNIFTYDIGHYEQSLWDRMEDFSTLLLGPTGSGKGAAAAAIGRSGFIPFDEKRCRFARSFTETFVPINLSQYAEALLESELFGHTKGAFTGAVAEHEGLFSLCGAHGTVFLDEIGEISSSVQVKLLKVLEEREFSPVGSHKTLRFSGRVIAATNKDIDQLRGGGAFRDDFYYRLCSDCICVPSLRQRLQEDANELDGLIAHTVKRIVGEESQRLAGVVREVIDEKLGADYPWPGNVRELAQCVRSIIVKRDYDGHVGAGTVDLQSRLQGGIKDGTLMADELLGGYCRLLYERYGTYEEVARRTGLDRRTAKKYVLSDSE